ncbi:MAG: hypothetical protein A2698_00305 [Candidatus Levybacteria bacterium RIFCSPHIGHO2_01_FULL_42_15]|nr:MAG: hypothetical protein A2698_00305 [Candidatus Levybacteria bacterium RIFCSPHIGHO2_01_FULL_42_15]OGH42117.1 MAG: hypothetical protein A3B53_00895 [Candidatus Levybacteria bacterium RIFCSPLOWO2_01_FULL_42_15]
MRERRLKHNGNAIRELKKRIGIIKSGAGFTLVEIIFSITVIAILSVIGIAGFAQYGRVQSLNTSALELIAMMNTAKSRALSQKKPASCASAPLFAPLEGYQVVLTSSREYKLESKCGAVVVIQNAVLKPDVAFGTTETFGVDTVRTFFFSVLTGGVLDSRPNTDIVLKNTSDTNLVKRVIVDNTGKISIRN